jgi:hypothetical protein
MTDDGVVILLRYDTGLIRGDKKFLDALQNGEETNFGDQYMFMVPQFEVASDRYDWLTRSVFLAQGRLAGPKQIEYALHRLALRTCGRRKSSATAANPTRSRRAAIMSVRGHRRGTAAAGPLPLLPCTRTFAPSRTRRLLRTRGKSPRRAIRHARLRRRLQ